MYNIDVDYIGGKDIDEITTIRDVLQVVNMETGNSLTYPSDYDCFDNDVINKIKEKKVLIPEGDYFAMVIEYKYENNICVHTNVIKRFLTFVHDKITFGNFMWTFDHDKSPEPYHFCYEEDHEV